MIFNEKDWYMLASLFDGVRCADGVFRPYAGHKPHVAEAPNGDTRVCDACGSGRRGVLPEGACSACHGTGRVPNVVPPTTRYLHVAPKYNPPPWAMAYLARAHYEACRVAEALGVPAAYYPRVADGTLRVLDYEAAGHTWQRRPGREPEHRRPFECARCKTTDIKDDGRPGSSGVCPGIGAWAQPEHTDPDLFTIVLYRSTPLDLELVRMRENITHVDAIDARRTAARAVSPGLHIGEIGELVGLGPATPHRVPARPYRQQSIVYFAIPDHAERLPCAECGAGKMWDGVGPCRAGQTVGEWLKERLARSRVYK